jgi:hypothetical protein
MKANGLLLAGAFIIVTNAIVMSGVARNQAGPPLQTIQLTESELPREAVGNENSGVSLRFQWERYGPSHIDQYTWLGPAKLEELGFDTQAALRYPKHPPLERPVFVALEYNGPHWEEWLKATEMEPNSVRSYVLTTNSTKLFIVDAATKPEPLLERYKNQQHYLIVRGLVRVGVVNWDPITRRPGPDRLQASVSRLLPESIHVPPPLSGALASLSTGTTITSPRYTVTLSYGRRFEPWVVTRP